MTVMEIHNSQNRYFVACREGDACAHVFRFYLAKMLRKQMGLSR